MAHRILLTGASGFLGSALRRRARGRGPLVPAGRRVPAGESRAAWCTFDVRDAAATRAAVLEVRPDLVVHAAATMQAEDLEEVIVAGTRAVARAAREAGAKLLHLSTDMVFDGEDPPYDEASVPSPNTPYGAAKARAEAGARAAGEPLVVRTSLLFAAGDEDPRTRDLSERLRRGEEVVLFTDEVRCPAFVDDVAESLWLAIADVLDGSRPIPGVAHLMGPEAMSRWEFGARLLDHLGLATTGVRPGTIRESGLVRPRDLTMRAPHTPARWRAPIRSPRLVLTPANGGAPDRSRSDSR